MNLDPLIAEILNSRKYRQLGIPPETVRDLLQRELALRHTPKETLKAVKQKMHNLVAPYLGDPDYPAAALELERAFATAEDGAVTAACERLLATHASTRERQPYLAEFYARLFELTGRPDTILDLACGLNPLSFPWMGLPTSVRYHAYDIHRPRVALINRYFQLQELPALAEVKDILVEPPQIEAPVAFFFKEAHRFEQRQRGCSRAFWQALRVRWLLVSLPSASLSGRHNLAEGQRRLVYNAIAGLPWKVTELEFLDEIVFCIEKNDSRSGSTTPLTLPSLPGEAGHYADGRGKLLPLPFREGGRGIR